VGNVRGAEVKTADAAKGWQLLGQPIVGGVLIVGDHAANHVPPDIDLGIETALLDLHIARDIGVADVATMLVDTGAVNAAFLAAVSRLVVDLNREEGSAGLIPLSSDGHAIPGNAMSEDARQARIERLYRPYHAKLAQILADSRPAMILSLHSFTPSLSSRQEEARPWQIGVLYNEDDRLARIAIPVLAGQGLNVGDQQPYSGRDLNYTMNRHAEGNAIPYLGIEMRQDLVSDPAGVQQMADWLTVALAACRNYLAQSGQLAT
jgi:predicted N-formylglutamate amidohydrolase